MFCFSPVLHFTVQPCWGLDQRALEGGRTMVEGQPVPGENNCFLNGLGHDDLILMQRCVAMGSLVLMWEQSQGCTTADGRKSCPSWKPQDRKPHARLVTI